MATQQPHQVRTMAESFGVDAERYDRTRPPYPTALVDRIAAGSPGRDVLDVGCGTGIVARQFRAAGCTVLGVEPDRRMAEFARRGGFPVEVATFETWDPAGRTFDAVVAGQTWHWVEPVAGAAKAARVLRSGGRLALFWHVFQLPDTVATAFAAVFRRLVPDSPLNVERRPADGYQAIVAPAVEGIRDTAAFDEPAHWRYEWERGYTRDEWLDQLPTSGGLTRVPPDVLREVLAAAGAAIDELGGSFTMRYTTSALTAVRAECGHA